MSGFVKGGELCEGFFHDCAKPILDAEFPNLRYSAALIGYGSDVLGYDDSISTDHMWGPRFYLFVGEISLKPQILDALSSKLPYLYRGFSVNFDEPDLADNGVRHPKPISSGRVSPLIFIETFDDFLESQLGTHDFGSLKAVDFLGFSEHRLLSLVSGRFFVDYIACEKRLEAIRFYPDCVKRYLLASLWEQLASEQAFMRRASDVGDDLGSRIICARTVERLMRLAFLYRERYAPYAKWLGTAFSRLNPSEKLVRTLETALSTADASLREDSIIAAELALLELHNASGLTSQIPLESGDYYGRKIRTVHPERVSESLEATLRGTELEGLPLVGSFSEAPSLADFADAPENRDVIVEFHKNLRKNFTKE